MFELGATIMKVQDGNSNSDMLADSPALDQT